MTNKIMEYNSTYTYQKGDFVLFYNELYQLYPLEDLKENKFSVNNEPSDTRYWVKYDK